ncbi:putative quinol monooxygenase [Methylocystis parvus]
METSVRSRRLNGDALYAAAVLIWIVAIWIIAFYVASAAIADDSAGVGGSSFLLGGSLATAGVVTIFSVREFLGAYKSMTASRSVAARGSDQVRRKTGMTKLGLLVTLEAKVGKEQELAGFLKDALPLVDAEPNTTAWFAIQMSASKFGIFDAFPDENGREAHLSGEVAKALMANAADLLVGPPSIEKISVLADKLPNRQ